MLRRFLLGFAALTALGAALLFYAAAVEPRFLFVRDIEIESPAWPANRAKLRIVFVSDPHIGSPHWPLERLEEVVARANALAPDIILLGGDYLISGVVGGHYVEPAPIVAVLAKLKAPLGVYTVLGNHDWWEDAPGLLRAFAGTDIRVLENQATRIASPHGDFWLAGVADDEASTPDVPGTFAQIDDDAPVIVLTHDPVVFLDVPARAALTLAGHTHGGQVYLPIIGAPLIPGRAPRRFAYGHIVEDGRHLYVTAGLGLSILPIRFNQPAEIAVITLGGEAARAVR